jgi:integrase
LLSTICRTAVNDELIARSPCRIKGASTEHAQERPIATVAELSAAIESAPEHWRLALLLAAWCQLRRSEILGLQRRDIDPLHAAISIERSWVAVSGGSPMIGPPKSDAGRRRMTIPNNVLETLELHLSKHVGHSPTAWLFAGAGDGPAVPKTLSHVWAIARIEIGRPDLRLHDLRHTGLTFAAATGATTAELMQRAGHASPQAALRYQHATADRDQVLADALGALAKAPKIALLKPDADTPRTAAQGDTKP